MGYGVIEAFVGPNGSGKSLAAVVTRVAPSLLAGRRVVANCTLRPEVIGCDPKLYVPLRGWRSIVEAKNCTLWLDEITACLPSRAFGSVPPELQRVLNQLRKQDVDVIWTAPNYSRCDVLLREVTSEVTVCRGYLNQKFQRTQNGAVKDERGRRVRRGMRWPSKKLFRWCTYDAQEYEDYQDRRQNELKSKCQRWYWRPTKKHQWLYESLAPVSLLDHLDDIGTCVRCGGGRRRPNCKCSDIEREEFTTAQEVAGEPAGPPEGSPAAIPSLLPGIPDAFLLSSVANRGLVEG